VVCCLGFVVGWGCVGFGGGVFCVLVVFGLFGGGLGWGGVGFVWVVCGVGVLGLFWGVWVCGFWLGGESFVLVFVLFVVVGVED
ncbi:hypothetical protein, partial [Pseudomonas syringae group genomosp. 7]|uniref:hypothetical protein n=1 Tax=Pseudomonas syringae group genomosp. 7 TaxID=251699 RepID=UPI0037705D40